ncbi:MAG: dTMP kinase [Candidatus Hydrothermarchaeota archaeon]|nr:MAG: dTMP kinase [Candidatus Hydrothermarchaeota archaeon]
MEERITKLLKDKNSKKLRSMFITIEGIDGAGKTTHAKLLASWLEAKGYSVFLTKEPTESKVGKLIREILSNASNYNAIVTALLFAADRAGHVEIIKKELEKGKIVISERYLHSSLAYQGASGLSIEWIREINKFAIPPDIIIYLDISPEMGIKRISSRNLREIFEKKEFLTKVRETYLSMFKNEKNVVIVDATKEIEKIQEEIRSRITL